ncbi:hypothetical protein [Leucobacter manosquensis]|uniref:DUF3618 domain-containing protein n=1 Tax=Leucobacter manosquensis TaxID=2810611 RepID=A0ABS5M527_9MICO|nr:hypothetical protein [Leucobacter manosquensis]MBS3182304.1 hypothetical protein [Leucobacter manosquensis]
MSHENELLGSGNANPNRTPSSGTVDTAKEEAGELAHTVQDGASNVAHTAKDEIGNVAEEASMQLHELVAQTTRELNDEASKQQSRLASGLQRAGDDLEAMASSASGGGVAPDLVRQTSEKVARIGDWLDSHEPREVVSEVKAFARRRPGAFIGIAAVAGVVAGRLTRALAANAHEQSSSESSAPAGGTTPARPVTSPSTSTSAPGSSPAAPVSRPVAPAAPPAAPPAPVAPASGQPAPHAPVAPESPLPGVGPGAPGTAPGAPGASRHGDITGGGADGRPNPL